ncbi:MAG: hypothetical protein AAGF12_40105 [Myxococcota bacterium]
MRFLYSLLLLSISCAGIGCSSETTDPNDYLATSASYTVRVADVQLEDREDPLLDLPEASSAENNTLTLSLVAEGGRLAALLTSQWSTRSERVDAPLEEGMVVLTFEEALLGGNPGNELSGDFDLPVLVESGVPRIPATLDFTGWESVFRGDVGTTFSATGQLQFTADVTAPELDLRILARDDAIRGPHAVALPGVDFPLAPWQPAIVRSSEPVPIGQLTFAGVGSVEADEEPASIFRVLPPENGWRDLTLRLTTPVVTDPSGNASTPSTLELQANGDRPLLARHEFADPSEFESWNASAVTEAEGCTDCISLEYEDCGAPVGHGVYARLSADGGQIAGIRMRVRGGGFLFSAGQAETSLVTMEIQEAPSEWQEIVVNLPAPASEPIGVRIERQDRFCILPGNTPAPRVLVDWVEAVPAGGTAQP